jgi:hypothetical protein
MVVLVRHNLVRQVLVTPVSAVPMMLLTVPDRRTNRKLAKVSMVQAPRAVPPTMISSRMAKPRPLVVQALR